MLRSTLRRAPGIASTFTLAFGLIVALGVPAAFAEAAPEEASPEALQEAPTHANRAPAGEVDAPESVEEELARLRAELLGSDGLENQSCTYPPRPKCIEGSFCEIGCGNCHIGDCFNGTCVCF